MTVFRTGRLLVALFSLLVLAETVATQNPAAPAKPPDAATQTGADAGAKKRNARAGGVDQAGTAKKGEPFDGATAAEMSAQCVVLQTAVGEIGIEIAADAAPETSRNFLNLASTGAYDETTFSRIVPRFVIQGGNLATGQKWTTERAKRGAKTVPDEPNYIKHVRGVVSLARPDEPNQGTSHFFILVGDAPALDGKFAAFGKVMRGMEVVDAINQAPADGEKPVSPVVIKHAIVAQCR
jgi:peptidyl-prolyl cis-trans isomerase B (cyclophilin B)